MDDAPPVAPPDHRLDVHWRSGNDLRIAAIGPRARGLGVRPLAPQRLPEEILLVDLPHNLDRLPKDKSTVLPRALERAKETDRWRLAKAVQDFGSARAESLLAPNPSRVEDLPTGEVEHDQAFGDQRMRSAGILLRLA